MSENINDMDQLLDEKISAMKFEFKDAYWTEMEALLNQQKRKKGLFWWVFGSSTIAVLILLLFWMNYTPANQYDSETIASQQVGNNETLKQNTEINTADLKNQKNEEVKNEKQLKTNSSALTAKTPTNLTSKSNQSNSTSTKATQLNHRNISTVNQKVEKTDLAQNALQVNNTSNSSNLISANDNQIHPNELDKTSANEVNDKPIIENTNQLVTSTNNQLIIAPGVDQMPILPFSSLNKNLMIPLSPIELVQRKPLMTHSFFAEAGFGYGANSFSKPSFGGEKFHLGFVYQLEKANWGLKTGLNASWTSVNGLNYFSRQKIYGFSSSVVSTQLNYRSLINMVIPLEATYHIKKHMIGLGVQLNVLLTTASKSKDWSDAQMNTKLDWNYRESLKPVSLAAVFDYTYNISKRWNIGAAFSYSITPVISNERNLFNQPLTRMFSGQLFIQYKLSNFKK